MLDNGLLLCHNKCTEQTEANMLITARTDSARQVRNAYRGYLRCGYSRHLARKLAKLMAEDARAGVYPLHAY